MKKRILIALFAAVMAVTMLVTSVSAASVDSFTDKASFPSWASEQIAYVVENGLMNGTGDGKFSPNVTVSRAQMAVMLYNLETAINGEPEVAGESTFTDISNSVKSWAGDAINWAAANGIVKGTDAEGKTFNPNGNITNGAMAVMLNNYVNYLGVEALLDITRVDETIVPVEMFAEEFDGEKDWGSDESWFYPAVSACGKAGLLIGSNNDANPDFPKFNLNNSSNRAQAAIVLTRLHKFLSIPTLEAEVIMSDWTVKYQNCAHPGNVYFIYSRNSARDVGSPELNQRVINTENIQTAFDNMFDLDPNEWRIEVENVDEIQKAFQGKSEIYGRFDGHPLETGSNIAGIKFALVNVEDPTIRLENSLNMANLAANGNYYPVTENYDTNMLTFLPSNWTCHDRRNNYQDEVSAWLNDIQAQYLAAVKQSDGKVHIAIDPDMITEYDKVSGDSSGVWYDNTLFGSAVSSALYYSWENSRVVDGALIAVPTVHGWMQPEYLFDDEEGMLFYDEKWGDVPLEYEKYEGTDEPAVFDDDGNLIPKEDLTTNDRGEVVFINKDGNHQYPNYHVMNRSQGESVDAVFAALANGDTYEVTMPLQMKLASDYLRSEAKNADVENVTFVFEANADACYHNQTYASVVVETTETPTVEALGDFYCAECGDINIAASTTWSWGNHWYVAKDVPYAGSNDIQDFLLYQLKMHAGAHMDISKWTIVDVSFDTSKWIGGSHGNTTSFDLTLKIGKAADPSFEPVAITVPCSIEVNNHIASPTFGWIEEGDNGWDIVESFSKSEPNYNGNKDGRMGDHFGCPHTDPAKDPQTFFDSFLDEYYCELHDAIHVNVHDVAELGKKANVTNSIKGLLMDYNNGESWKTRYNEGIFAQNATTSYVIDGKGYGAVTVTLDGYYSDNVAYCVVPYIISCDTDVPTTGLVPAEATLTNVMTGETKSFCASTEEYKAFLAECDAADETKLDEALAEFQTSEYVTVYYNSNNVHGSWDPMFMGTTVMSFINLDESFLIKYIENNWYTDADDDTFKAAFIEEGWWQIETGIVVCDNAKIPFTFKLRSSGRLVEKTIGIRMVAYNNIDGVTLDKPADLTFEGTYDEKLANDLTRFGDPIKTKINALGAITVKYNCNAPEDESWTFGEIVGTAIAEKAGLVCNPGNRYDYIKWEENDYHAVRLPAIDGEYIADPATMPNGWDIENGQTANTGAVNFEFGLPGCKKNAWMTFAINVTLIRDTSLPMNTAVVQ